MSWYNYPKYTSHTVTKEDTEKAIAKLRKKNPNIAPVILKDNKLANTWWAKSWNSNLEKYADYSNRIGRGKSYVRKGAVLDLQIEKSIVKALVQGSRAKPYEVEITIDPLKEKVWKKILEVCNHKIDSLERLTEGRFPEELTELFTSKETNLFPSDKEIHFECSCPDWAGMCKHVAATLYGIGARFDEDPLLFFKLRDIDFNDLLKKTIEQKMDNMLKNAGKPSKRALSDEDAVKLFFES